MKEIILFGKALAETNISFKDCNTIANQKGYIVDPKCCNKRVMNWLGTLPTNYNSTFYKSWNDVVSKNRIELLFDQIKHYCSTYGTNFEGEVYIPNENPDIIAFNDYKVISPISISEIGEKIQGMFNSGIALKQETIDDCLSLVDEFNIPIDINSIKNKEVLMYVHKKNNTFPNKPEEMVRFLVYLYTGKTLLIKDKATIKAIKANPSEYSHLLENMGLDKLAEVFHRFKPLFLAMKKNNERIINKIARLADKFHKPYQFGYFEQLLSGKADLSLLDENLKYLNNFKKVLLLQTIKVRRTGVEILPVLIRNGKLWVTEKKNNDKAFYSVVYTVIYKSLIDSLSKKSCKIRLNPSINLALPTSEKNFIGNVPFGSYVDIADNNSIIGINWRGDESGDDLDLSYLDEKGNKIGWNSSYYDDDKSIIYSGDMTYANPEATELMYVKNRFPNGVVKINGYSDWENSKFTLIFAKTNSDYVAEYNKTIDPNDIIFSTKLELISREMLIGILTNNRFTFANIRTGNKRISNGNDITTNYIDYCEKTSNCLLNLKDVLTDAGFEFVTENPDIDLSVLDKSTLINLLS
jgi:hypothetical protein